MVTITTKHWSVKALARSRPTIKSMILNMSAKSLVLLLAVTVAMTTTAFNLRHNRSSVSQHGGDGENNKKEDSSSTSTKQYVRNPGSGDEEESPSAVGEVTATTAAAATTVKPSIVLDKSIYAESESITATFSVGSPSHSYYSSSEAPSLNLDYNYPQWSIGLFMRDADPQGGTLSPIVSVNFCGALGKECDANDRSFASYNDMSVTFSSEYSDLMEGRWPLEMSSYGTGFDAYVLDGKGAAAIGPLGFNIQSEDDEDANVDTKRAQHRPAISGSSSGVNKSSSNVAAHPLLQFRKGNNKASGRHHASISKATAIANVKIVRANALVSVEAAIEDTEDDSTTRPSKGNITSNKEEYESADSVSINFSLSAPKDGVSNYRIGIFMRMTHPQGGALDPIISLPLCSNEGSSSSNCITSDDITTGLVMFSEETIKHMMPNDSAHWPIDFNQWGTGFDAYILDGGGDGVVGPVKFNVMMNDTY